MLNDGIRDESTPALTLITRISLGLYRRSFVRMKQPVVGWLAGGWLVGVGKKPAFSLLRSRFPTALRPVRAGRDK